MPAPKAKIRPAPLYHPGPLIDCVAHLDAAVLCLRAADPDIIGAMLAVCGPVPLRASVPGFEGLAKIIVSQQVSVASAAAIFGLLAAAYHPLTSRAIVEARDVELKACGLSWPKIRALRSLADTMERGELDLAGLASLGAAEAHQTLVAVKGIGPWTADIFLMSCLGHPDAWPAGDVALQEAARLVLGLETRPDTRGLEAIGERWRPHRAVAARILWAYYKVAKACREGIGLG